MDNAFIYSVPGRAKAISDIRYFVPGAAGQLVFDVIVRAKYGEQISEKEAGLAASILSSSFVEWQKKSMQKSGGRESSHQEN